jgi:hypothetical protein
MVKRDDGRYMVWQPFSSCWVALCQEHWIQQTLARWSYRLKAPTLVQLMIIFRDGPDAPVDSRAFLIISVRF